MRRRWLGTVLVAGALAATSSLVIVVSEPGSPAGAASATTLHGEGGSFAEPVVNALEADKGLNIFPLSIDYFDANVDVGRSDFVAGTADFAVSEFPLTTAQAAAAKAAGRSFAYVPIAANALALGAVVECEADIVWKATTMCPNLRLSAEDVAKVFTNGVTQWTGLPTIGGSGPISPALGNGVTQVNPIDPSANNYGLAQYIGSTPAAKALWDAWLTVEGVTNLAPTETWPAHQGLSGGDLTLANALVPIDPATNAPRVNPQTWGVGDAGAIPADWLGTPRNIPTIALQNAAGAFVPPTLAATQAAVNDASMDTATDLVTFPQNAADAAAYPQVMMSYLIVPTTGLSQAKAHALAAFIQLALSSQGQADITGLGAAAPSQQMIQAGETVANTVYAEGTSTSTSSTTTSSTSTTTAATISTSLPASGSGAGTSPSGSGGSSSSTAGSGSSPSLAFTGANLWPLVVVGAFLAVAAGAVRRRLRRRGTPTC